MHGRLDHELRRKGMTLMLLWVEHRATVPLGRLLSMKRGKKVV